MWATGFVTDKQDGVESEDDSAALRWMQQTATEQGCAISGSLAVRTADGLCRNRHYFVTPDALTFYDKHHLFTYGHEDRFFTAGRQSVVVEWLGRRFLLLTCYDLRFPLWARYGRVGEYDAIIVVANWPDTRQQAFRVLCRARAIENQCYLLGVNRVGTDPMCRYVGESLVSDSKGDALIQCEAAREMAASTELDFEKQDYVRRKYHVLDDRD
jgi:predicted amidohydrolase